jgi:hypothetical protein
MNDQPTATLVGDPIESPITKPLTRAQRAAAWRKARACEYTEARDAQCTCTPTRAQMLLLTQWEHPPID